MIPGEILPAAQPVEIHSELLTTQINVTNTGPVPVHITAHFHVFEANPRLKFNRLKAYGKRLDIHAKGSVRFEPGETTAVQLVPIGGARIIQGFNGAVNGPLADVDPEQALVGLVERGFMHDPAM